MSASLCVLPARHPFLLRLACWRPETQQSCAFLTLLSLQVLEIFVDEAQHTSICELEITITKPHGHATAITLLKVVDVIEWSGGLIKSLRAYKG